MSFHNFTPPTPEVCEACYGVKQVECRGCDGSGSETCCECGALQDCYHCSGTGLVDCVACGKGKDAV